MDSGTSSSTHASGGALARDHVGAPEADDLGLPEDLGIHTRVRHLEVLYRLGSSVVGARDLETVYAAALDAVIEGLGADRASLLMFDPDGVLRFKTARGLSPAYQAAVEGHTPWAPDTPDPRPILVPDVRKDADLRPFLDVIEKEGIRSLAFVPLRHEGRVLGKFMAYFNAPHVYSLDEVRLGEMIANHVAIVIARQVAEEAREELHTGREAERAQLEAVLRHIPMGVVILDAEARTPLLQNEPGIELWARAEEVLQAPDSPLATTLARGEVLLDAEIPVSQKDGMQGFVSVSGSPIRDEDGRISSAVVVLEDISVRKRAETALRFLANASVALAESLDFEKTLQRVAELMVPEFADWCDFDFVREDGTIQLVSIVHSDPSKIELAHRLRQKYPVALDADGGIGWAVRHKKTLFIPLVSDELLRESVQDDEHYRDIRELGLRSAIIVPLIARDRVLGTLTLVMAESGRHYVESDLPYVEELAQSCAFAIDNARLYAEARRELEERQRAEAALKDSEERYRMLSEVTSDYIFSYRRGADGEFELEWISDAFERITGYSRSEIMDRDRWSRVIPPEDLPAVEGFSANMARGDRQVLEHRIVKKSGEVAWLRIYGRPIIDDSSGVVKRILGAGQDITARKEAEKALHDLAESLERRVAERTRALASANERLRSEVQERSRAEEQLGKAN
ncbi:MAG TPA: GAF domain-containing protein, partial [Rhodothermales bacterium]